MDIFGLSFFSGNKSDLLEKLFSDVEKKIVFTPNPEMLIETQKDVIFTQTLKKANYLLPDGIGLYLAFQILDARENPFLSVIRIPLYIMRIFFGKKKLYKKFGERICGSDITKDILKIAEEKGERVGVIDLYNPKDKRKVESQGRFISQVKSLYPRLDISLYIWQECAQKGIIEQINNKKVTVLFSTLGMKQQEENIILVMSKAQSIRVGLGVGSSFDYITGMQKRAPRFLRNLGFEWLYRLFTGPKKLKRLKRLYNAIFVFIYTVLKMNMD